MQDSSLSIIVVAVTSALIVLAIGLGIYLFNYTTGDAPITIDDQSAVEGIVSHLGARMKTVSLLAPPPILGATIEGQYSEFVATSTWRAWINDPLEAPGSLVSSPWPDRIEIASSTSLNGHYIVDARVVEATSEVIVEGGQSGSYPVRITLEKENGRWLIVQYERLPIADISNRIMVEGTYVCLPRRDTADPQTLECTLGLFADEGHYYGLDLSILATGESVTFAQNERVRIEGTLAPVSAVQDPRWERSIVVGIILVSSAEVL